MVKQLIRQVQEGRRVLYVFPSYERARQMFITEVLPALPGTGVTASSTDLRLHHKGSGGEAFLQSSSGNLVEATAGLRYGTLWVDEAAEVV